MDINLEYAAHQHAVMRANSATSESERIEQLARASSIAARIGAFQHELGAAAACAWSVARVGVPVRA
ncbi:hypothetical protein [Sphingobium sp. CR28]|uniref:hypothetical protein n=1 Tax=Sphingobium sp. CR28 TaxID=3400272 RepID=UPI003FEDB7DA